MDEVKSLTDKIAKEFETAKEASSSIKVIAGKVAPAAWVNHYWWQALLCEITAALWFVSAFLVTILFGLAISFAIYDHTVRQFMVDMIRASSGMILSPLNVLIIAIFTVFGIWIHVSISNSRGFRHLASTYWHRHLIGKTHGAFMADVKDAKTSDAILMATINVLFAPPRTGLIGREGPSESIVAESLTTMVKMARGE